MNRVVCTIVEERYLHRALAMMLSLRAVSAEHELIVLTIEEIDIAIPGFTTLSLAEICKQETRAQSITKKYNQRRNALRWSLKPVLLSYIIRHRPNIEVLYCDSDCCFFSRPDYIFGSLRLGGIVLTPHWRPLQPSKALDHFRYIFLHGLFNAGCVAANERGLEALDWWAEACLVACEKNCEQGLYDDQRYLDLMPVYFPETIICRHYGVNLADWNLHLRQVNLEGTRLVPDQWPVVLVHFTMATTDKIEAGDDPVLRPYLERYNALLGKAAQILSTKQQETLPPVSYGSARGF